MSVTLIVEPNPSGHRLYYVRLLAQAAVARGDEVVLALSEKHLNAPESMMHLADLTEGTTLVGEHDFSVAAIEMLSRRQNADVTVIPDGDRFAMRLACSRGWKGRGILSVLIMREIAQPGRNALVVSLKSRLRTFLFERANAMRGVRVSMLKSATWTGTSKFPTAHDPVTLICSPEDVTALRAEWSLDRNRYWFGVLGAIHERKNVPLIARALAKSNPQAVGLLIAGQRDQPSILSMSGPLAELERAGGRVIVIDRLLGDRELDAAVAAVDCVVLAHSNESPSGLFGKSAVAGTRVVAAGALSLRHDAQDVPSLAAWSPLELDALANSLHWASLQPRPAPVLHTDSSRFTEALL